VFGVFRTRHKRNSFCHRSFEFFKSNKSPYFHDYLGLLPFPDACSKTAKATSPLIFMTTWGFCPSLAPAPKPQKQQVPSISCLLGAFCSSNMKNSFCYHISEFFKSNKSPYFHGYLGLLPFPDACFKTAKATSPLIFMPTWGFCRSRTLAASGMTPYGQ